MHVVAGSDVMQPLDVPRPNDLAAFRVVHFNDDACNEPRGIAGGDPALEIVAAPGRFKVQLFVPQHNIEIGVLLDRLHADVGKGDTEIAHHQRTQEGWNMLRLDEECLVLRCRTASRGRGIDTGMVCSASRDKQ